MWRTRTRLAWLILGMASAILAACGTGSTVSRCAPGECTIPPALVVSPGHGSTVLSATPAMSFVISDASPSRLDQLVKLLSSDIALTRASGASVPLTLGLRTIVSRAENERTGGQPMSVLDVTPSVALSNGTYRLSAGASMRHELSGAISAHQFEDGRLGSQFEVGGSPTVRDVQFCRDLEKYFSYILFNFSQLVSLRAGATIGDAIRVIDLSTGQPLACSATLKVDIRELPPDPNVASYLWTLRCDKEPSRVRLEITDKVVGLGGEPVRKFGETTAGWVKEYELTTLLNGCFVVPKATD